MGPRNENKNKNETVVSCFDLVFDFSKKISSSNSTTTTSLLGTRSKSQDAIRNHRKTVRFVSDKQEYQPILDSTNIGGGYRLTHLEVFKTIRNQ